MRVITAKKII